MEPVIRKRAMKNSQRGFTLIELMTVLAVIGILAAIALPYYSNYVSQSADSACLAEVRAYSGEVMNIVSNPALDEHLIPSPENKACQGTTDASQWQRYIKSQNNIEATARAPGKSKIICDFQDRKGCWVVKE